MEDKGLGGGGRVGVRPGEVSFGLLCPGLHLPPYANTASGLVPLIIDRNNGFCSVIFVKL